MESSHDKALLEKLYDGYWTLLETASFEKRSSDLSVLSTLKIPVSFTEECSLIELIKAGFGLDSSSDISPKDARKLLAQYGMVLTRSWKLFIARKNKLLNTKIREVDPAIISCDHFIRKLPEAKIPKNPKRFGKTSVRGALIDFDKLLQEAF